MKTTKLEILTPRDKVFTGEVESLIIDTVSGSTGFLPGHVWCQSLLKENGSVQFREPGHSEFRRLTTKGGYVEIRDIFTVYTESAEWVSGENR